MMMHIFCILLFFLPNLALCQPENSTAPLLNLLRRVTFYPPAQPEPKTIWQDYSITAPKIAVAAVGVTLGSFALYKVVSYLSATSIVKSCVAGVKSGWFQLSHLYYRGAYKSAALKKPATASILLDNKVSNTELKLNLMGLKEDITAARDRIGELKKSLGDVLTEELYGDASVNIQEIVEKLTSSGFLTTIRHKTLSNYPIDANILQVHAFTPEQVSQVKQVLDVLVVEHSHVVEAGLLVPYFKDAIQEHVFIQASLETCLTTVEEVLRICSQ